LKANEKVYDYIRFNLFHQGLGSVRDRWSFLPSEIINLVKNEFPQCELGEADAWLLRHLLAKELRADPRS
jgi:hypothetical protein